MDKRLDDISDGRSKTTQTSERASCPEIPEDSTNPIQLADWLELQAITAADSNASQ